MTNQICFGKDSGGDYVLRIAKTGVDALYPQDDEDLIFSSDWLGTERILQQGSVFSDAESTTVNLVETLNYQPFVRVTFSDEAGTWFGYQTSYRNTHAKNFHYFVFYGADSYTQWTPIAIASFVDKIVFKRLRYDTLAPNFDIIRYTPRDATLNYIVYKMPANEL